MSSLVAKIDEAAARTAPVDAVAPLPRPEKQPVAPKLRRLDVARMTSTPPPPVPWRVQDFAVDGAITMLAGREGQGKSMVALALAAGTAHGRSAAGMTCHRGAVLVVDAENGEGEAHRRLHGLDLPDGALEYHVAEGFNLAADLALIAALLREHRPALLVLDSYRSLWPGGDENDSGDVEAAIGPLRNLVRRENVATVLLHHAGKGGGHDYRGSTGIGAAVELGFTLRRVEGDPEAARRRQLACWKCRPAPEPAARWLALRATDNGPRVTEAEPFAADAVTRAPVRDALAPLLLSALRSADTPMTIADLARAIGKDERNGTVRDALKGLEENGDVVRGEDKRYALPEGASERSALGAAARSHLSADFAPSPRDHPVEPVSAGGADFAPGPHPFDGLGECERPRRTPHYDPRADHR